MSIAPFANPFTVVIDAREHAAYGFSGITADANRQYRPLEISTIRKTLETGDYTIEGMENYIAVERKSLEDLYATLGQRRTQFEAEHERLAAMAAACVVIEAGLGAAMREPPGRTRLNPKTVFRTWISWSVQYGIPWFWCEDRRLAEITTFRFLEKCWKYRNELFERSVQDAIGREKFTVGERGE